MRLVADPQELWRNPLGKCLAGPKFFFFCATLDLWGYRVWGDLEEPDISALGAMIESELVHDVPPHASYMDITGMTSLDASFYPIALDFLTRHASGLASMVLRMAVVRPRGVVGAIAEGISTQIAFVHPLGIFSESDEALRFLGVEHPTLVEELDAIQRQIEGVSPLLRRVRVLLEARPGRLPLAAAAKAVGLSARTLQRNLSDLGTSFQNEVNHAQVACAKKLLAGDAKLSTIAIDVGCPSLQHFSTLFRRMTGETPSAWRKKA